MLLSPRRAALPAGPGKSYGGDTAIFVADTVNSSWLVSRLTHILVLAVRRIIRRSH